MSDQKINVDININADSLNQIPQYKAAFDSLKSSIDNVNKEIIKYNNQNRESVTWGTKIKGVVKELYETYDTCKKVIKTASDVFKSWTNVASVAFTLITTYGPQVLDFLSDMFQSDKTKEAAEALRTYKDVMASYITNVSDEISQLGMLVNIANSDTLSKENKLEAVKQLNNLSPQYLNNLTLENIKTKEGIGLLNEYTASLNRKAMEEAIQSQRVDLVKQRLTLKPEYDEKKRLVEDFRTGKRKSKEPFKQLGYSTGAGYVEGSEGYIDVRKPAEKAFTEVAKKDADILKKISLLDKTLSESLVRYAPKPDLNKARDKSYWEIQLANQQKELDKLDAGSKDFEAKAKPIIKRINETKKTLNMYSVNEIKISVPSKRNEPKSPKPDAPSGEQLMAAHAKTLTETIQSDKKAYDQEMALLDKQINKKLINQAEYNKKSRELQEQYHQSIGKMTNEFIKRDMQATLEHSKQVAEAESRKKGIEQDEKNVKKAILPWKQFEAEKKLIEDKFAFEIFQAQGNEEKIKEIKEKSQQAQTELAQKYEQQRKDFALNTAQQVADKAFSIIGNNIKSASDAKIKGLEKDKAGELSNKNLTETQRKAIEDKYQKKEAQEKVKAFKAEQRMSVLQAVVNGALAVTKATAQTGVLAPFVIPGIIASTALQIATIVAQKPPAFAKGGRFVSDGRGALLPGYSRTDNTNAYLRSGEAVVVSEAMRNPWARNLVSAINVAHGGRDFSVPNTGRGYAIGGIFTDGGNANRYYSQPVNDVKELANTMAYQMINNFPPIYVDVKDVNNQQNILAQTVNRVNL
ncbi:hypothetical protein GWR56_11170 [Mucilaginibacter sp. 14171R-50]|uniref:hypothetical protein n=1 Tax=Mucilaginibacter sp. 14171R-50 TaxID=2703789 RepID=UPI00138CBDE2|nr:hypothetical protein [Mucilaginibacter sp. 14171R-50]QHS56066.1 hypothetical protein GWR56_11170 [Mucilaginibacter sp. 14171R-50]